LSDACDARILHGISGLKRHASRLHFALPSSRLLSWPSSFP